jgi:hypothetical protein
MTASYASYGHGAGTIASLVSPSGMGETPRLQAKEDFV